jgi:hypothetical protein
LGGSRSWIGSEIGEGFAEAQQVLSTLASTLPPADLARSDSAKATGEAARLACCRLASSDDIRSVVVFGLPRFRGQSDYAALFIS